GTGSNDDPRRRDPPIRSHVDDGGDAGDRDDQISARAELEERGPGRRRWLWHEDRGHQFVRTSDGPSVADDELPDRDLTPAADRPQLGRGIARHEVGQAVGGGRGIAEIAGQGPTVLDLDTTD